MNASAFDFERGPIHWTSLRGRIRGRTRAPIKPSPKGRRGWGEQERNRGIHRGVAERLSPGPCAFRLARKRPSSLVLWPVCIVR